MSIHEGVDETERSNIRTYLNAAGVIRVQPPAPGRTMWFALVDGELTLRRQGKSHEKETTWDSMMASIGRCGCRWYFREDTPFEGTDA